MEKRLDKKSSKELKNREKWSLKSRINAFIEALKLPTRQQKAEHLMKRLEEIREDTEKLPSITEAVTTSHQEEDLD